MDMKTQARINKEATPAVTQRKSKRSISLPAQISVTPLTAVPMA